MATARYAPHLDPSPAKQVFFHGHPSWRSMLGFYLEGCLRRGRWRASIARIDPDRRRPRQRRAGRCGRADRVRGIVVVGFLRRIATTYAITNRAAARSDTACCRAPHAARPRLERVQNVNTRQSVLERMLRVGTVDFDTAGSDDFDFAFRGVADPREIVRAVDRARRRCSGATPGPRR